jgi:Golgi nucleoside diphosphatase
MGKHQYGLVFDAGSSGTRVYIYQWLNAEAARADDDGEHLTELPKIKTKKDWIKKVKPGVSTFGTKPEKVGPEHLKELVDFALSVVPKKDVAQTPIFLLATAGMRLLPDNQRSAVLENICSYFQKNTKFQLPDCAMHVQVIPGETEGLYGWVAANYLLGARSPRSLSSSWYFCEEDWRGDQAGLCRATRQRCASHRHRHVPRVLEEDISLA